VNLHVLQAWSGRFGADNKSLATVPPLGIPPATAGVRRCRFSFDIDANGFAAGLGRIENHRPAQRALVRAAPTSVRKRSSRLA